MFEKVNPKHPDKIADRIAGAMVDKAYEKDENSRIAVEVLLGHGICHIIAESSVLIRFEEAEEIVQRIAGNVMTDFHIVPQDHHLAKNQDGKIRCGDNGIFKGVPMTDEQKKLTYIAEELYTYYPYDGKYILDGDRLIICQSNSKSMDVMDYYPQAEINPIGEWTGGSDVDAGATNKKLGSDMADSVTGGGLHGKDCSKADVSANIYCWLKAQETGEVVEACCAIGWTYKVRPTRCFEMLRYNTVIAKLLSTKGANPEPFEYYDLDNELGIVMMFYTNYLDNHEERASLGDRILYG